MIKKLNVIIKYNFMNKLMLLVMMAAVTLSGCALSLDTAAVKQEAQDQAKKTMEENLPNEAINQVTDVVNDVNQTADLVSATLPAMFAGNQEIAISTDGDLTKRYTGAILKTNFGDIKVVFYGEDSPKTVANFIKLSLIKFYDGSKFHRVIPDFMIQGGDPNSKDSDFSNDGIGGPGYKFEDEINTRALVEGSLAMANAGPNTNGSQFFIVTAKSTPWLDGKHTNFGQVTEGLEVIKKIEALPVDQNDHPIQDAIITGVELVK